ncbi:MAG: tRNA lysidine(34) synthetase TilS [Candidatus Omnitrophica bacterium]|nr:tRNA lysidine(34) synthetase TilS [Candidatus Omnitrophota bacterium]
MIIGKILSDIKKHNLFAMGDRLLVCVSGGPDSVFLLHCLKDLREKYKLKLFIAHVNHKLRGVESDAEEAFVYKLSLSLKAPFYKCSVPTELIAGKEKLTLEEAARNLRYKFFTNNCHIHKIKKIILAHTKDDQVETIIMRMLRGTGINGLCGMRFESRLRKFRLIRPLLEIEKQDILDYLKKNKIKYMIDSSNLKTEYFRNKVRLEIIPMLKHYSPQIKENIFRIGETAKQTEDILREKVKKFFAKIVTIKKEKGLFVNKQLFLKLPLVLRYGVIRKAIGDLKGDLNGIDFKHVQIVDDFILKFDLKGKHLDLPKDIFVEKSREFVCFWEKNKKTARSFKMGSRILHLDKELRIPELNLCLKAAKVEKAKVEKNLKNHSANVEYFDLDTMALPLEVRLRKTGDLFYPLGDKGKKKLKKFFIDQKIEDKQKDCTGLVVSSGIIAWVIGLRLGDPFKVTKKTKRILKIQAKKLKTES